MEQIKLLHVEAIEYIKKLERERDAALNSWRCFHCDEVFTDRKVAYDHFGPDDDGDKDPPACVDPLRHDEKRRLTELRDAQDYTFQQQERANEAEQQRDASQAHAERLRAALKTTKTRLRYVVETCMESTSIEFIASCTEAIDNAEAAFAETPVQSLEAIRAEAGRERAILELERLVANPRYTVSVEVDPATGECADMPAVTVHNIVARLREIKEEGK